MATRPRNLQATPAAHRRHQRLRAAATRRLDTAPTTPTHEQIALRAYEIYLRRGNRGGDATSDWLEAERELLIAAAAFGAAADALETTAREGAGS